MSTFDDASLVFIPSGYKTSKAYSVKPIDGSGDLTFTRSNDTATRVASNGLIEKVRTNIVLQSQTFDNASWTKSGSTVTANATTAPDGTTTADKLIENSSSSAHYVYSTNAASSTITTISVYAKKAERNFATIFLVGTAGSVAWFDLDTGVVGSKEASVLSHSITSVGNGWYRCSATYSSVSSNDAAIGVSSANNTFSYLGNGTSGIFIWAGQGETGDIATDYIVTTTAAVSVGPVANVPRLDYLNSSCPKLQMEPQRVNLIQFSEIFDNAWWAKSNSTISSNAVTSPDGYTNADNLVENTANSTHGVGNLSGLTLTAAAYTFSVFVKKQNRNFFAISTYDGSTTLEGYFNINTGAVATMPVGLTGTITSYGNGWYRCSVTRTMGANSNNFFAFNASATDGGSTYTGTGVVACSIYGGSLELGSYATSYIPTLGSASTRGADAASKTGISSLIGQTEGTVFFDAKELYTDGSRSICILYTNGSSYIQIYLVNDIRIIINGSFITQGQNIAANTRYKIAFAYKAGQHALYVNGVQIATSSSSVAPTVLNDYYLGNAFGSEQSGNYTQALLFKTRLTNAQLAELTTL